MKTLAYASGSMKTLAHASGSMKTLAYASGSMKTLAYASAYPANALTTSAMFCPPKPKLFDSACRNRTSRARFGT
jgi:hypothetical protein